ncbi:TPA: di-heme oxidoredictase family protein [Pseudomonas aeruginosa]
MRTFPLIPLTLSGLLAACGGAGDHASFEAGEQLSGGATTVQRSDKEAFSLPAANLTPLRRMDFFVGNGFFRGAWHMADGTPGQAGRIGLGPLFNTDACQSCHIKDGRGHPPQENSLEPATSTLVRLSIPPRPEQALALTRQGVIPEPTYGGQLQDIGVPGHPAEGRIHLSYQTQRVPLHGGEQVALRKPRIEIRQLGYGPMQADTLMSMRVAPPMIGLGLLEAIDEADLLENAARQAASGGPVHGRVNRVWDDARQRTVVGRFGWKAGQPVLNQQNAHAFSGDMGLTTTLLASDDCTAAQQACRAAPQGGEPEVSDKILASVLFYSRTLAVPARRAADSPEVLAGKALFHRAGCAQCHRPSYVTGQHELAELSQQRIYPYTDLLLHDMGEGLADGRGEFLANGREWRTPPLWGIGLTGTVNGHTQFLHDGRARNLLEAILWHGGEALQARDSVAAMVESDRKALLAFLQSL